MHLTRCKDQPNHTLDEFYTEASQSQSSATREIGKTMLELLASLRALPNERRVYGLTSHYHLCLLGNWSGLRVQREVLRG